MPPLSTIFMLRMRRFQPIDPCIIERRHFAVFFRRQTFQPGLASVHDERIGAGLLHRLDKYLQRLFRILIVDADAAFHRNGDRHGGLHRGDAVADERGFGHEAGAEAPLLHPIGRAADIQVDFVEAKIRANACAGSKRLGI